MEKEAVLTVSDLSLYYSKKKALNTINMTFYKNEITALIGPQDVENQRFYVQSIE